jgi:hypothetical protein
MYAYLQPFRRNFNFLNKILDNNKKIKNKQINKKYFNVNDFIENMLLLMCLFFIISL